MPAMKRLKLKPKREKTLAEKYPPSRPCGCATCLAYCMRPGWWTVEQAAKAIDAGYGGRMMLEMAPERTFGVLSPAVRGSEVQFAPNLYAQQGCTFLNGEICELHGTGHKPLECSCVRHDLPGLGPRCHAEIEKEWNTPAGRALVVRWSKLTGFWESLGLPGKTAEQSS